MKVAFIQSEAEALGIEYLSAVLKAQGHETKLYFEPRLFADSHVILGKTSKFFDFTDHMIEDVIRDRPDLLCFSVLTDNVRWALNAASKIREKLNALTLFGGIHAYSVPERLIQKAEVDAICLGEGEEIIAELADRLERDRPFHDIAGLYTKINGKIVRNPARPLNENLDTIPFPDKNLYYGPYPFYQQMYTLIASRGCPNNCTYCNNNVTRKLYQGKGKYLRLRSVENVMEELRYARATWALRAVDFHDDIFTTNKEWIRRFCEAYKRDIRLPFKCIAHVKFLDEETLYLLEDAGCRNIQVGVETFDEDIRRKILNRHMSNEQLRKALMPIQKTRIGLIADHMFALPHENEASQVVSAQFYNEIRPKAIYGSWLTCYPQSSITRYCLDHGIISTDDLEAMEEGNSKQMLTVGGQMKGYRELRPFQFILGYIPVFPKWLISFLLRKRRYRFLPGSPFIAIVLPRFITSFFWEDIRAKLNLRRYRFFIFRAMKMRFLKPKKSSSTPESAESKA